MAASRENSLISIADQLGPIIELNFGSLGERSFNTSIVLDYLYNKNHTPDTINTILNMIKLDDKRTKLIEGISLIGVQYTRTNPNNNARKSVYDTLNQMTQQRNLNASRYSTLPYTSKLNMPGSSNASYAYGEMLSRNEENSLRSFIEDIPIDPHKNAAIRAGKSEVKQKLKLALEGYVKEIKLHPTIAALCAKNSAHRLLRMISTCYRLAYDFAHDWRMIAFLVLDKLFSSNDNWNKDLKGDVSINVMLHRLVETENSINDKIKGKLHKYISNCHASLLGTRAGESTSEERCRTAMLGLNRELIILSNDPSVVGEDVTPWLYDDFKDTLIMSIELNDTEKFKKFLNENIWGVYLESCNIGRDTLIKTLGLPEGKYTQEEKDIESLVAPFTTAWSAKKKLIPITFWEANYDAANVALISGTVMIKDEKITHKPVDILGSRIQAFPKGTDEEMILAGFKTLSNRPDMIRRINNEGGLVSEYNGCIGIIFGDPVELSVNKIAATLGNKCLRGKASAENMECLKMEWLDKYKEEDERAILCLSKTWTDEIQRIELSKLHECLRNERDIQVRNGVLPITLDTLFQYAQHADGSFPYFLFSGFDNDRKPCLYLRCFNKTALKLQEQADFSERQATLSVLINQNEFFLQTANALLKEKKERCDNVSTHTAYPYLFLASAMLASNIPAYERKAEIEKEKYANLGMLLQSTLNTKDINKKDTLHLAVLDSPNTVTEAIKRAVCVKDMLDDFDDGLARIHATFRELNTLVENPTVSKSVGLQLIKTHLDVVAHVRDAGVYKDEYQIQLCAIAAMAMHYEGSNIVNAMIIILISIQDNMLQIKSLEAYATTEFKHVSFAYISLKGYFITDPKKLTSEYPKKILKCIYESKHTPVSTLPKNQDNAAIFNYLCNKDPEFSKMMQVSASLLFVLINMREGRENPALLYRIILAQETNNSKGKKPKGRSEDKMSKEKLDTFKSWYEQLHPEHGKTYTPSMVVSFKSFADECMKIEILSNAWNNHVGASSPAINVSSAAVAASSAVEAAFVESQFELQLSPQTSDKRVTNSLMPNRSVLRRIMESSSSSSNSAAASANQRQIVRAYRSSTSAASNTPAAMNTTFITSPNTHAASNASAASNTRAAMNTTHITSPTNPKGGGTKKRKRQTHKRQQRKRKTRNRKARKTRKN